MVEENEQLYLEFKASTKTTLPTFDDFNDEDVEHNEISKIPILKHQSLRIKGLRKKLL